MIAFNQYESEIDEGFFRFDYKLSGKVFKATLDKYLIAKRTDNGDLTEEEIEYLLESCAAFRESFWVAYLEVQQKRKDAEMEFEIGSAKWMEEARVGVVKTKAELCGGKITGSLLNSIAQQEVRNWMLMTHEEEYRECTEAITKLVKTEQLLYGTYHNLKQRGTELQTLLKGKRPENFQGEIKESYLGEQ